jgi:tetratricopeptide (TPR) repeat protein
VVSAPIDAAAAVAQRADLLRQARRPAEAMALLAPQLAANPDDPALLRAAFWALHQLGEPHQAEETARRLIATGNSEGGMLLATALSARDGTQAEVADLLTRALAADPTSARLYRWAIGVELDPENPLSHRLLGQTALRLGHRREARTALRRAVALDPGDAASVRELNFLEQLTGGRVVGLDRALRAVRADPLSAAARHNLRRAAIRPLWRGQLLLTLIVLWGSDSAGPGSGQVSTAGRVVLASTVLIWLGWWTVATARHRLVLPALATAVRTSGVVAALAAAHAVGVAATVAIAVTPSQSSVTPLAYIVVAATLGALAVLALLGLSRREEQARRVRLAGSRWRPASWRTPIAIQRPQPRPAEPSAAEPLRPQPRPATVAVAAVLSGAYSLGLLWFGFAALVVLFRTGGWGDRTTANGMVFVGVVGLIGAALLIAGAIRTWRGSFTWTLAPLAVVFVFGFIGEMVDLLGTATAQSNLIGTGILVAAALPIGLLNGRAARNFAAARRHGPR